MTEHVTEHAAITALLSPSTHHLDSAELDRTIVALRAEVESLRLAAKIKAEEQAEAVRALVADGTLGRSDAATVACMMGVECPSFIFAVTMQVEVTIHGVEADSENDAVENVRYGSFSISHDNGEDVDIHGEQYVSVSSEVA